MASKIKVIKQQQRAAKKRGIKAQCSAQLNAERLRLKMKKQENAAL